MSGYVWRDGSTDGRLATCGDKRGTRTGYNRHRRAGERPCDECRAVNNAYERERFAANPERVAHGRLLSKARSRALAALARRHPAEFQTLLLREHNRLNTEGDAA